MVCDRGGTFTIDVSRSLEVKETHTGPVIGRNCSCPSVAEVSDFGASLRMAGACNTCAAVGPVRVLCPLTWGGVGEPPRTGNSSALGTRCFCVAGVNLDGRACAPFAPRGPRSEGVVLPLLPWCGA